MNPKRTTSIAAAVMLAAAGVAAVAVTRQPSPTVLITLKSEGRAARIAAEVARFESQASQTLVLDEVVVVAPRARPVAPVARAVSTPAERAPR